MGKMPFAIPGMEPRVGPAAQGRERGEAAARTPESQIPLLCPARQSCPDARSSNLPDNMPTPVVPS